VIAFEDVTCIQADMEDVNRVYRSDAQVRLGPHDLPCMAFAFVVKHKTGMEIYIALHARDIRRALIYRVDPDTRNIGDPSPQLKTGLDLLRGLGFSLDPVNLQYGSAMLEVVLQDVPVLMTPAKAKKQQLERTAMLNALETQAAFLEEMDLLEASEQQLQALSKEERNRYQTGRTAYQKLLNEDRCDEQREELFHHVDALLHGRKPSGRRQEEKKATPTPVVKPALTPSAEKDEPEVTEPPAKSVEPPPPAAPPAPPKQVVEKSFDPKDRERIVELEKMLTELERGVDELKDKNQKLNTDLTQSKQLCKAAEEKAAKLGDLTAQLEAARMQSENSERDVKRLKSDLAKAQRRIDELESHAKQVVHYEPAPDRSRSRLGSGRSLLGSSKSSMTSGRAVPDPPHVARRPPPAGAIFGVDWDLECVPCQSPEDVIELHQSICNAQLTLEGYPTQYCSAYIVVLRENGGRQLFMVFRLPQEDRFLVYRPVKKPSSSGELSSVIKEAHKFLQVVGVETETIKLQPGKPLPSSELGDLLGLH